jgi:hypothetical protein
MATVDIDDVIDSLEDALRAAETIRDGGIEANNGKTAALEAIAQIRRGEHSNAITTLEREFLPKWQSTEACHDAYRKSPIVGALAVAA